MGPGKEKKGFFGRPLKRRVFLPITPVGVFPKEEFLGTFGGFGYTQQWFKGV